MVKGANTMSDTVASGTRSKVVVIIGAQWGDEGKGRMVDLLGQDADIVCRCQVCNVSSVGVKVAATCCRGARGNGQNPPGHNP